MQRSLRGGSQIPQVGPVCWKVVSRLTWRLVEVIYTKLTNRKLRSNMRFSRCCWDYYEFEMRGLWSGHLKEYWSSFQDLVCAQRVFPASSQLVLAYLHLNGATISRNCVATVIPLICNVWSPVPNAGSRVAGASGSPGYQRHDSTKPQRDAGVPHLMAQIKTTS